jgi:hypothetical protein
LYSCNVRITSFLKVFTLKILREIVSNILSSVFYTIMADQTADVSNKEQLIICIRWVDDYLIAHEDFIGMHSIKRTTACNSPCSQGASLKTQTHHLLSF